MEILQFPLRKCYHRFKARIIATRKFEGTDEFMSLVSVIDCNYSPIKKKKKTYSIHNLSFKTFCKAFLRAVGPNWQNVGITLLLCNVMSSSMH